MYLLCACVGTLVPKSACVDQRETWGSQSFPSTVQVPGVELGSSVLAESTLAMASCQSSFVHFYIYVIEWIFSLFYGTQGLTDLSAL